MRRCQVAEGFTEMPAADIAALYIALVRFTGAVYPQRLDLVDQVLASCQEVRGPPAPTPPAAATTLPGLAEWRAWNIRCLVPGERCRH